MLIAALSVTQATLTLPGIAGLVLTLAVAVDANVLIYERMRDESRAGRSVIAALDHGYSLAWPSIADANLTSLISAGIMFLLGSGPVKGFAWTLSIGVMTSVFTAMLVTQVLIGWWFRAVRPKTLPHLRRPMRWPLIRLLPSQTKIDFVRLAPFRGPVGGGRHRLLRLLLQPRASTSASTSPAAPDRGGDPGGRAPGPVARRPEQDGRCRSAGAGLPALANAAVLRFKPPEGKDPNASVTQVRQSLSSSFPASSSSRSRWWARRCRASCSVPASWALGIAVLLMLVYIWFRSSCSLA